MATYKDDLDIIKAAEKDSSKLSLNAITELDNKGLLGMYGGGGSSDNPVKLADVRFDGNFEPTVTTNKLFAAGHGISIYTPEHEEDGEIVPSTTGSINGVLRLFDWNQMAQSGTRLIVPHMTGSILTNQDVIIDDVSGEAEIVSDEYGNYLRITGDCVITVKGHK